MGFFGGERSSPGLATVSSVRVTAFLQLQQEEQFEAKSILPRREVRNLNILATSSFLINRPFFLGSRLVKVARWSEKGHHILMSRGSPGSTFHSSSSSGWRFFLGGFWLEAFLGFSASGRAEDERNPSGDQGAGGEEGCITGAASFT